MLTDQLGPIFGRHGISPKHQPFFRELCESGNIARNQEFATRLSACANYKACLFEILELLSAPFNRQFAQAPFQSLDIEQEIACPTQ
jgi:hypothetical protein